MNNIRSKRKAMGLSQAELGMKLVEAMPGTSQAYAAKVVSMLENDHPRVSPKLAAAVTKILGITLDEVKSTKEPQSSFVVTVVTSWKTADEALQFLSSLRDLLKENGEVIKQLTLE